MILDVFGLPVVFPFSSIYPEQLELMREMKTALDAKGHALVSSPTGTGKTVALLSLVAAYQHEHRETGKLIYCTRTVPEMTKCVEEYKVIHKAREEAGAVRADRQPLVVCLSSRKNLCIHPRVAGVGEYRGGVDAACRRRIAPWVRAKNGRSTDRRSHVNMEMEGNIWDGVEQTPEQAHAAFLRGEPKERTAGSSRAAEPTADEADELCTFYETLENASATQLPTSGVFTLDDMRELGKELNMCPYFLIRRLLELANVVVYNFSYLLDPKVAHIVSSTLPSSSIVIFDEAHNVDNVCIESLSIHFDRRALDACTTNVSSLTNQIQRLVATDKLRLQREYDALVSSLNLAQVSAPTTSSSTNEHSSYEGIGHANPVLPEHVLNEAIPGSIRRAEHFLSLISNVVAYLKTRMDVTDIAAETPTKFVEHMASKLSIEHKTLRFAHSRLDSLMRTLEIVDLDEFSAISRVCDFLTLVATARDVVEYKKGFMVLIEPFDPRTKEFRDPRMELTCLDASLAIKPVFKRFETVIITGGTLSPIEMYPKLLDFAPKVTRELTMTISRPCILPLIVTRGSDQAPISSAYSSRNDSSVVRNYGQLLIDMCSTIPDGLVCFFTAYETMENVVSQWDELGILKKVLEKKLVFVETKDVLETTLALDNYRKACDSGRGAVFLSIARGKVSEGIDFEHHYGRCVILFGVPFQYTKSQILILRLAYLRSTFGIKEGDFLAFDALRCASQCLGRVLRSKQDWGLMILADRRFADNENRSKLPPWISNFLSDSHARLSTDEALAAARVFLREIAQKPPESGSVLRGGDQIQAWNREREREVEMERERSVKRRAVDQW